MAKRIKEKINEWRTRGAVAPSSKFLVKKMLSKIDFREDLDLLQLGYGNGVFTKELVRKISKESTLVVFEIDKNCYKYIINDERLIYIQDSAEKISDYYEGRKFDHIISTLPFASLPIKVSLNVFEEIKKHLKKNGKFLQFQYSLFSKKDIFKLFNEEPNIDFELFNLPPAFIYETKNNTILIKSNLEKILQRENMKLADLAKKTGINNSSLRMLINNQARVLNFETLDKICLALSCSPGDILKNESKNN